MGKYWSLYPQTKQCHHCKGVVIPRDSEKPSGWIKRKFCGRSCASHADGLSKYKKRICKLCNKEFDRPRDESGKPNQSRICAACNSPVERIRRSQSSSTKGELFSRTANWQSARSMIQCLARKLYLTSGLPQECLICGYENHIEVCHKKAVSKFSDSAILSEINSISNLTPLCPTHHWEFDNQFFSIL